MADRSPAAQLALPLVLSRTPSVGPEITSKVKVWPPPHPSMSEPVRVMSTLVSSFTVAALGSATGASFTAVTVTLTVPVSLGVGVPSLTS